MGDKFAQSFPSRILKSIPPCLKAWVPHFRFEIIHRSGSKMLQTKDRDSFQTSRGRVSDGDSSVQTDLPSHSGLLQPGHLLLCQTASSRPSFSQLCHCKKVRGLHVYIKVSNFKFKTTLDQGVLSCVQTNARIPLFLMHHINAELPRST